MLEVGLNELESSLSSPPTPPTTTAPKPPRPSPPQKQAPRPPEQSTAVREVLISSWDYAKGLQTNHVEVGSLKVDVFVDTDDNLQAKIASGEYGLTWQRFVETAQAELNRYQEPLRQTITDVDKAITEMVEAAKNTLNFEDALLLMEKAMAKVTEANSTIAHYAREGAYMAQQKVAALWKDIQGRASDLRWFKIKVGLKLGLYAISMGLTVLNAVLSGGATAIMAVISFIKICADITNVIIDATSSAKTVATDLEKDMERLRARIGEEMSNATSAEQFFRDLATAVSPFTKNFISSIDGATNRRTLFLTKLSGLESLGDTYAKKINELVDKIDEAKKDTSLDEDKLQQLDILRVEVFKLLEKTQEIGKSINNGLRWADAIQQELQAWQACRGLVSKFPGSDLGYKGQYVAALGAGASTITSIVTALT